MKTFDHLMLLLMVAVLILQVGGMDPEDEDDDNDEYNDMRSEGQVVDTTVKIALIEAEMQELGGKKAMVEKRIQSLESEKSKNPEIQQALQHAKLEYDGYASEISTLHASIKPLYGVLSVQHLQEHRLAIYESFGHTIDVGKNHVFYDMIFSREEVSLQSMLQSFIAGVVFGYVIGLIGFVFTAPFTIYQYCDSFGDLPAAFIMWLIGLALFLLPAVAIVFGLKVAAKVQMQRMREEQLRLGQRR